MFLILNSSDRAIQVEMHLQDEKKIFSIPLEFLGKGIKFSPNLVEISFKKLLVLSETNEGRKVIKKYKNKNMRLHPCED
jgi:hypothetical protein